MMRKLLAIGGAAALALSAMAASADEVTGTITNIDLTRNTFQLEGKTFTASPTNTVGAKLSELEEGDKVTVEATDIETGTQPINAMRLEKAE
jgi:ABC-type glycerol-3-phosphate transport system substrate-binding protein